jgi:hypothetical protein
MHLFVNKMADPDISDYECDGAYVQSEQEGRRLLLLRRPDFAIKYLFQ